jgi:putative lipoprotein (rSAM/lipoprotein system)
LIYSLTNKWKFVSGSLFAIVICSFAILFFSGCNFDPYKATSTQGDTATYKINGKIINQSNDPVQGIKVWLLDSVSSVQSEYSAQSDSTGNYSLNISFIRRNSLILKFRDADSQYGVYPEDSVMVSFDDFYFTHGFPKTVNKTITRTK